MLYLVRMDVHPPADLPAEELDRLRRTEKARALELQRSGEWRELWRIAGEYANYSVFDVESHDALHDLLSTLPLFPFMTVDVTPLATHPSHLSVNQG
jgi:muconolactone D-isomerase